MTTHSVKHFLSLLACGATALLFTAHADLLLIEHSFGGDGAENLHGTDADTFNITGTRSWSAHPDFKADGSIAVTTENRGAWLNLGDYINDAIGTADGKFTLTTTIQQPSGGLWVSGGFAVDNSPLDYIFPAGSIDGLATSLVRSEETSTSNTNYFPGPGTSGTNFNAGNLTGTVTFTTVLDFTPAGGYNVSNKNFGTVTFANSVNSNTFTSTYDSNYKFNYIGFTASGTDLTGQVDFLQLTQIPEPSTVVLLGLALLASLVAVRRR